MSGSLLFLDFPLDLDHTTSPCLICGYLPSLQSSISARAGKLRGQTRPKNWAHSFLFVPIFFASRQEEDLDLQSARYYFVTPC